MAASNEVVDRLEFPFLIKALQASSIIALKAVLDIDEGGMHYSAKDREFVGSVRIGVVNIAEPTSIVSLPQSVSFVITSDSGLGEPAQIEGITKTFDMRTVKLRASKPSDVVRISIRPSFDQTHRTEGIVPVAAAPLPSRPPPPGSAAWAFSPRASLRARRVSVTPTRSRSPRTWIEAASRPSRSSWTRAGAAAPTCARRGWARRS